MAKQSNPPQKQHQPLGFRAPDSFRGATFSPKSAFQQRKGGGFNPSTFKGPQHKG